MDGNNATDSIALEQWDDEIAEKYVWNTVILVLLLILGITGNGVVVLVYGFKMRGYMDDRFFIPVLAVVDLLATIVICGLSLDESLHPVTRYNVEFCKSMNYLAFSASSDSLFILVIIAMQRYLKICRPFGYQIEMRAQRIAIIFTAVMALLLFSPLIYMYTIVAVQTTEGYKGYICTILRDTAQASLLYYQAFVFVLYLGLIIIMSVLYVVVARQILKTTRMMNKRRYPAPPVIAQNSGIDLSGKERSTGGISNNETNEIRQKRRTPNKGKRHLSTYRYSYIFMIITIKTTIAFIGPWVVSATVKSTENWSETSQNYILLRKMFLLSHVTNPIIYGVFDTKFKTALKAFITLDKFSERDSL